MTSQVRHSFPAWRIFTFGQEVSNDASTCNWVWGDGRSPATCEFTLASELDRYVVTPDDIAAMYDDIPVNYINGNQVPSKHSKEIDSVISDNITRFITDPVKRKILLRKVGERISNVSQAAPANGVSNQVLNFAGPPSFLARSEFGTLAEFTGDVARFPFQAGQCVFHTGDPLRIFWRDPFDFGTWYFSFTGYVTDWKEHLSVNGKRVVTITGEGMTRPFRLARVALNPAIYDINVVTDNQFDQLIRNFHTEAFQNETLPEILYDITFPRDQSPPSPTAPNPLAITQYRYGVNGRTQYLNQNQFGVGFFNYPGSQIFVLGDDTIPKEASGSDNTTAVVSQVRDKVFIRLAGNNDSQLENWQKAIDHIVPTKISDDVNDPENVLSLCLPEFRDQERTELLKMASNRHLQISDTEGYLDPQDVITRIGSHPEFYPVDFGRLMILIPASLGPGSNRDIMFRDLASGVSTQTEFISRLQIIYNICQRIEFSFYETPRGDIVCEMPLYSYRPEDFGQYQDRYKFPVEDTVDFDTAFEDGKVRTIFRSSYWLLKGFQTGGNSNDIWAKPGTAALKALIPQFGLRMETLDPWGFINSQDAAAYYSSIKLSQMNADAWHSKIDTVIKMGIGPNRPCYFQVRDFIATVRNVNAAISWGKSGSVTQSLQVNYRRGWSGQITGPLQDHVYESYGGRMSQPLDYSVFTGSQNNTSDTSTKKLDGNATQVVQPAQTTNTTNATKSAGLKNRDRLDLRSVEGRQRLNEYVARYNATASAGKAIPDSFLTDDNIENLANIIDGESKGFYGRPNSKAYPTAAFDDSEWSAIADQIKSGQYIRINGTAYTATGLGQMIVANVKNYYPDGVNGIGDPYNETIGMLRYIHEDIRPGGSPYGDPAAAWAYKKANGTY